jgi:hypothetical protein
MQSYLQANDPQFGKHRKAAVSRATFFRRCAGKKLFESASGLIFGDDTSG